MSSSAPLAGQVALVTGASRGIGRAIALQLAEAGAEVVVNYASSADAAEQVVSAITAAGGKAYALKADVSQEDQVEQLMAAVLEKSGRIDVLINRLRRPRRWRLGTQCPPSSAARYAKGGPNAPRRRRRSRSWRGRGAGWRLRWHRTSRRPRSARSSAS